MAGVAPIGENVPAKALEWMQETSAFAVQFSKRSKAIACNDRGMGVTGNGYPQSGMWCICDPRKSPRQMYGIGKDKKSISEARLHDW
jgi:hypothetical protein